MKTHACIDDERLAAYFDGLMSDAEEEQLHADAANCPDCQEHLVALAVTLKATDEVPAVLETVEHDASSILL